MTITPYAGMTRDGKMILTPEFAESIRREYQRRGLPRPHFEHVAESRAKAFDAAPADDPQDAYWEEYCKELDALYESFHAKSCDPAEHADETRRTGERAMDCTDAEAEFCRELEAIYAAHHAKNLQGVK